MPLDLFSAREKDSRWWMMNFFLRLAKRMLISDDPTYQRAAELMLNGMLSYLTLDYFNFRDLVWKGEKDAIRYWTSQDPSYLRSFLKCLKEQDPAGKLRLFEELAEETASPVGAIWEEGTTALHIRDDEELEKDASGMTRTAQDFWAMLVDGPSKRY